MNDPIALIDADSLLYKVGFAIEDKVVWNELEVEAGLETELDIEYTTDLEQCFVTFQISVDNILSAVDCDEYLLVFTGGDNFRYDLPTPYKENRIGVRKPTGYHELLAHVLDKYPSKVVDGYEADDYVVAEKTLHPDKYIVCAIDKDVLYQSVGTHYNYRTDEEVTVTELEAIKYMYFQTLAGDTSDGYKGCPGIGKIKANNALVDCKTEAEMWQATISLYETKGLTTEDAVLTMQLANMHQLHGTEIILWQPPLLPTFNETTLVSNSNQNY